MKAIRQIYQFHNAASLSQILLKNVFSLYHINPNSFRQFNLINKIGARQTECPQDLLIINVLILVAIQF